jgi:hypothetical protein
MMVTAIRPQVHVAMAVSAPTFFSTAKRARRGLNVHLATVLTESAATPAAIAYAKVAFKVRQGLAMVSVVMCLMDKTFAMSVPMKELPVAVKMVHVTAAVLAASFPMV